jgi:hypothetical protein
MHKACTALKPLSSRFLSFDIETTGLIEDGHESAKLPELLCAAALVVESDGTVCASYEPITWPEVQTTQSHACNIPARVMNKGEVLSLVDSIWSICAHPADMRILAWNGVGYDLRLLYMHCTRMGTAAGMVAADHVREMALASCDPMLNFAYRKGFPVKLSAAAKLISAAPMSKTGEGAECADKWLNGDYSSRIDVLRYCANDVAMTAAVFAEMQRTGALKWETRAGRQAEWRPYSSDELIAPCLETMKWEFANNDFMRRDANGKIDNTRSVPCPDGFVGWLDVAKGIENVTQASSVHKNKKSKQD